MSQHHKYRLSNGFIFILCFFFFVLLILPSFSGYSMHTTNTFLQNIQLLKCFYFVEAELNARKTPYHYFNHFYTMMVKRCEKRRKTNNYNNNTVRLNPKKNNNKMTQLHKHTFGLTVHFTFVK